MFLKIKFLNIFIEISFILVQTKTVIITGKYLIFFTI